MKAEPNDRESKARNTLVRDFWDFLSEVGPGGEFGLWNLQGALRWNPGVPCEQSYRQPLIVAIEDGLIKPVQGRPDFYRRTYFWTPPQVWNWKESMFKHRLLRVLAETESKRTLASSQE